MLISESWLREWVALDISTEQLAINLTQAGLEVETVEPVAPLGADFCVGEVVEIVPHPDADKLNVCKVSVGESELLTIVCGAPNAALGIKAPVALEGAKLPNGMLIEKRAVRGVDSCGMLCSLAELGLEEQSSGLMLLNTTAQNGQLIDDYLILDDNCIDVDLTPDRGDCLSIAGVAREMSVIAKSDYTPHTSSQVEAKHAQTQRVMLAESKGCPRYVGRIIKNINSGAQTPDWMQQKLRRVGLRSIAPVVDVTNFVMMELGQPMHAFDHSKINGDIAVRLAQKDEALTLLDGQSISLSEDMLLITDERGPIALAGIIGGLDSAIDANTNDIFLEAAYFSSEAILGRARKLGLHTDASHRFERGVDFDLPRRACERASELLLEIVGGEFGEIADTVDTQAMPELQSITLRHARVNKLLGIEVDANDIEANLLRLGMPTTAVEGGWKVTPPSWRFDIRVEHDLIEEVGRTIGFDQIVARMPKLHSLPVKVAEQAISPLALKQHLAAANYREVVSYSFVDPVDQQALFAGASAVGLANPIAENMSHMRLSIWTGLLNTAKTNQQRQHQRHRYFELGNVFYPNGGSDTGVEEIEKLALLLSGNKLGLHWQGEDRVSDYYDLKGELDRLFARFGLTQQISYLKSSALMLHPGQAAEIQLDGKSIGLIGALHPTVQKYFDLNQATYLAEVDLNVLANVTLPSYDAISRFPESKRDLAFVVDQSVPAQQILEEITQISGKLLKKCVIFDTYTGDKVEQGKKSLAAGLTFQSKSDSVSAEEVESAIGAILNGLESKFDARLRT